jgi:hypothetical protein
MKRNRERHHRVNFWGISEATSGSVLSDTNDDDSTPRAWISIDGLRQLGAIVQRIRERAELPSETATPPPASDTGGPTGGRRRGPAGPPGGQSDAGPSPGAPAVTSGGEEQER